MILKALRLRVKAFLFLLCALLVPVQAVQAAKLELVCPCSLKNNGATAISIIAGIINLDSTVASSNLRMKVLAHKAPHYFDGPAYIASYYYFQSQLGPSQQLLPATYTAGFFAPPEGNYHITLVLQEMSAGIWLDVDQIRMKQGVRSTPRAGGASYSNDEAEHTAIFMAGRATSVINGNQITVNMPKLHNVSPSHTTGNLEIQIRQSNSQGAYYTLSTAALGGGLAPLTEVGPTSITTAYSEVAAPAYGSIDVALVDSGSSQLLTSQQLFTINGTASQRRYFSISGVNLLNDADSDGVSDYNESLVGTDPQSATSKPPKAVLKLLVYYSQGVPALYANDELARIDHLISVSNQVLTDSNVNIVLELAAVAQININEADGIGTTLQQMLAEVGTFAGLSATRKNELIDVVLVMRPHLPGSSICGIASLSGVGSNGDLLAQSFANNASGVVDIDCSDTVTAHELGHIMGLAHSRIQTASGEAQGTFPWSSGHSVEGIFSSIMAATDGVPVALYSAPNLNCFGLACGVDRSDLQNGADSALSLNVVSYQVAAFAEDTDGDGIANALDDDDDGDGTLDIFDEVPLDKNNVFDFDLDGIGNNSDPDDDADGEPDISDDFPLNPFEVLDTDSDGVGNNEDLDDDNDGYSDVDELDFGSNPLDPEDTPEIHGLNIVLIRAAVEAKTK
jgi:hypothetical protein